MTTIVTFDARPVRVLRDGEPVSPILPDRDAAMGWLLGHQPMSTDWAMRHEGYTVAPVEVEPWPDEEAKAHALSARQTLRHGHMPRFDSPEDEHLTRENCAACAIEGYGEGTDDGSRFLSPNHCAWERVLVEAHRPIRRRYYRAFIESLNGDDRYAEALRRSVATYGVRFVD